MHIVKFISQFTNEYIDGNISCDYKLVVYIDILPKIINDVLCDPYTNIPINKYEYKYFFLQIESYIIISNIMNTLLNNEKIYDIFDKILTFDNSLLKKNKSVKFLPYQDFYWCKSPLIERKNIFLEYHGVKGHFNYNDKIFTISFMCAHKNYCIGHKIRHQIWDNQYKLNNVQFFYGLNNENMKLYENNIPLTHPRDKTPMYKNSMFCIVVENNRSINYYTEKLMECIVSKTIPIYYGCPNIEEYFNINGFILFETVEQLIEIIIKLDEKYYYSKIEYINENYNIWLNTPNFQTKFETIMNMFNT
jgi:hypothetical protein